VTFANADSACSRRTRCAEWATRRVDQRFFRFAAVDVVGAKPPMARRELFVSNSL
jgi:hypothetical protein